MAPWRYLDSGFCNGYENMAIDEALFLSCQQKQSPPTIRFYGWSSPALSLGYFQNALTTVNLDVCSRRGIDVVRRISGGRAVLHDNELTYALICPEDTFPFGNTILASYRAIGECLLKALRVLGLNAQWVNRKKALESNRLYPKNTSCFSTPSWYEITVEGKKICGSAQKRGHGVVLQHGSLLIECDPKLIAQVLSPDSKDTYKYYKKICATTTAINVHLSRKITFSELKILLCDIFEKYLNTTFIKGELTADECTLKNHLLKEKYHTQRWNLFLHVTPTYAFADCNCA